MAASRQPPDTHIVVHFRDLNFTDQAKIHDVVHLATPRWHADPQPLRLPNTTIQSTCLQDVGIMALSRSLVPLTLLFDMYLADLEGVILPDAAASALRGELVFQRLPEALTVDRLPPLLLAAPERLSLPQQVAVGPDADIQHLQRRERPWRYKVPRRREVVGLAPIHLLLAPRPPVVVGDGCPLMRALAVVHGDAYAATRRDVIDAAAERRPMAAAIEAKRQARVEEITAAQATAERNSVLRMHTFM